MQTVHGGTPTPAGDSPNSETKDWGVRVNQFFMALAAQVVVLAGAFAMVSRLRGRGLKDAEPGSNAHRAAFDQSPNSMLMVDAGTLKVIDANAAAQRNLGYTLDEVRTL